MKNKSVAWVALIAVVGSLAASIGIFGYRWHRHLRNEARQINSRGTGASCKEAGYGRTQTTAGNLIYCDNVGGTALCNARGGNPILEIRFPKNGPYHVGTPVTITFDLRGLGSGDATVITSQGNQAQGGRVDWGDGKVTNADITQGPGLHSATHTYTQIGSTTIKALAWAQYKYQNGPDSGSYESCVDATPATLTIVP